MKKTQIAVISLAWLLSAWLIIDGLTFKLMPADPALGKVRGCYTAIEDMLGSSRPYDSIRVIQLSLGITLFAGIPTAIFIGQKKKPIK